MKPLTLAEAAQFLRMSRSSLYQRKDIPRYRRPGSRVMLFDQDELEVWLQQGRMEGVKTSPIGIPAIADTVPITATGKNVVDISQDHVYHRSAQYR